LPSWNTPHPTELRSATFSHRGRRESALAPAASPSRGQLRPHFRMLPHMLQGQFQADMRQLGGRRFRLMRGRLTTRSNISCS
jgi:hypothetical protein